MKGSTHNTNSDISSKYVDIFETYDLLKKFTQMCHKFGTFASPFGHIPGTLPPTFTYVTSV